jgi:hypothetical protein
MPEEVVKEQWKTIRSAFTSLRQAWDAWKRIRQNDPFQWDHEESKEQLAAAHAQGQRTFTAYSDPAAGATLPFVLLALSLAPTSELPPDVEARGLMAEIRPVLDKVLADETKWEAFVI